MMKSRSDRKPRSLGGVTLKSLCSKEDSAAVIPVPTVAADVYEDPEVYEYRCPEGEILTCYSYSYSTFPR